MAGHLFTIRGGGRERPDMYVLEEWMVSFSGGRLRGMDLWVVSAHGPHVVVSLGIMSEYQYTAYYDDDRNSIGQFPWYDAGVEGFHQGARYMTRMLFQRASDPLV
jgi:hypothetical protein